MKAQIKLIKARLRSPFVGAWGAVSVRELVLLVLEGSDGQVGWGEAAPLGGYDGVGIGDVRAALEDCRGELSSSDGLPRGELLAACAALTELPQAIAAIDLALLDLAGRRAGKPVWQMLDAHPAEPPSGNAVVAAPEPVAVNATIAASDRAGAAREATAALTAGFGAVKLKVGTGDDAGRLAAVRAAAGPQMAIRLDANGAWSVREAIAALRTLAPTGIELCEEPVSGLAATRELVDGLDRSHDVPGPGVEPVRELSASRRVWIAIDETTAQPGALDRRVCDAVCLKIARCGGITGVIDAARRARGAGYEIYLASTLDGPLGIAAALHAAAALEPDRACGLATLDRFEGCPDVLPVHEGRIAVPSGAGLGDGLRRWYESVDDGVRVGLSPGG
ncbi:MAG: mandelate racemase/muconate lactonizing enzyme family protein [Solirubrobacteraceae bacterium]